MMRTTPSWPRCGRPCRSWQNSLTSRRAFRDRHGPIPGPQTGRSTVRQQGNPCPPTGRLACPLASLSWTGSRKVWPNGSTRPGPGSLRTCRDRCGRPSEARASLCATSTCVSRSSATKRGCRRSSVSMPCATRTSPTSSMGIRREVRAGPGRARLRLDNRHLHVRR